MQHSKQRGDRRLCGREELRKALQQILRVDCRLIELHLTRLPRLSRRSQRVTWGVVRKYCRAMKRTWNSIRYLEKLNDVEQQHSGDAGR